MIAFILGFGIAISHPYEPDLMGSFPPYLTISPQTTSLSKYRLNIDLCPFSGLGFYKNINSKFVNFEYSIGVDNNQKVDHKIRFLVVDYQGLFYKTLLKYGSPGIDPSQYYLDTTSGEYLFNQFGFKALEWNNLENYYEINILSLSTDFIFENRAYTNNYLYGLHYKQKNHNIYFIPRFTAGFSRFTFDSSKVNLPNLQKNKEFWDIPIGVKLELGYDWSQEIHEIVNTSKGPQESWYDVINTLSLTYENQLLPINNSRISSYGLKAIFDLNVPYLNFTLAIKRSEVIIDKRKSSFHNISLEYPIAFYSLMGFK